MLIKSVHIKNFQSHINTKVDFSRYLNVIIGTSRAGKSALLRAIFQVFNNEIPWDTCYTWDSSANSYIKIIGNDHTIERIKGKADNSYIIDGVREDFVGTQTPERIAQITNIASHNLQRQDDIFFMIDMNPGPLSKAINKVSGLSIIDACIKETAQRVRDTQADVRFRNVRMINLQSSITDLEFLIQADIDYSNIESLKASLSDSVEEFNELSVLWSRYRQAKEKITKTEVIDQSVLDSLNRLATSIEKDSTELASIENSIGSINEIKKKVKNHKNIDLALLHKLVNSISNDQNELQVLTAYIQTLKTSMIEKGIRAARLQDYKTAIGKIKICPTCNRPL